MATDAWQPFADLIEHADLEGAVAALEAMGEPERKRLSARAKKENEAPTDIPHHRTPEWTSWQRGRDVRNAIVFGTGTAAGAARDIWRPWEPSDKRERLIRCRPREWRQELAERVMAREEVDFGDWPIVHRMVSDGLIDRPAGIGYVVGAVMGIRELHDDRITHKPSMPLADALRGEPEWLREDLWRLFEVDSTALSNQEAWKLPDVQSWQSALVELAADGAVPRDRLLDASLAALRRDFTPAAARWHYAFYEALEPTPEEHVARLDELLALLASEDPAIVGFALRVLDKLERAKRLPADKLLEAIAPAVVQPVKGHAARAVKLAGRVLNRAPDADARPALLAALMHEARDVQEPALAALEPHRERLTADDRARLAELAEVVDPALRPRVEALAGELAATVEVSAGPAVAVPGRRLLDRDAPRLTDAEPLTPVADVDDLFDRAAVALERNDDPDELELVLDGIGRLHGEMAGSSRAGALLDRAQFLAPPSHIDFGRTNDVLLVALLRCLGGRAGRQSQLAPSGRSPREAIAQRVRELLRRLPDRAPRPLLSAPTHRGGWIEPAEAVRRIAALDQKPLDSDLAQLVLRLAPDGRDEARAAAAGLRGEPAAVLVRALGGEPKRPLLARLKVAWAAADHARDPAVFALPAYDLDDESASSRWNPKPQEVDPASPADLLVLEEAWWGWEAGGIERWLTTVWPANREGAFQLVVRRLWLNTGNREYGIGEVLEVLLDPTEPIREQAALAVALGLGTADAADRTLAADVTIAALTTRRLDGAALGAPLARLLREHAHAVPARWATSLTDVAAAGPLTAHDVQAAVEAVLAVATPEDSRRLLGLVDLLRRLAVEADAAVADPAARVWLEGVSPRSKAGRAAQEALAVSGAGAGRSRAAAASVTGR